MAYDIRHVVKPGFSLFNPQRWDYLENNFLQETEQRFGKIEKSISGMEELMKKQQEMMENFIKKFES